MKDFYKMHDKEIFTFQDILNDETLKIETVKSEELKCLDKFTFDENKNIVQFSISIEDYKPVTLDVIKFEFFRKQGEYSRDERFRVNCKLKGLEVLENKVKFTYILV